MSKVTLAHIGAVSLGRLLAIWTFVLGTILLLFYGVVMIILAVVGLAAGADIVQTLLGIIILVISGLVGLVVSGGVMFVFGFLSAVVYNIVLGVGGGIDLDFKERA